MKHMVKLALIALLAFGQAVFALPESVNVNTAEPELLAELLTGVGASRAQAIVDYREKYGEFAAVEDLLDVRGIGPAVVEANRDRIVFED